MLFWLSFRHVGARPRRSDLASKILGEVRPLDRAGKVRRWLSSNALLIRLRMQRKPFIFLAKEQVGLESRILDRFGRVASRRVHLHSVDCVIHRP